MSPKLAKMANEKIAKISPKNIYLCFPFFQQYLQYTYKKGEKGENLKCHCIWFGLLKIDTVVCMILSNILT